MATLEQACRDSVGKLRAALIDLYDCVGADPSSPQDVARNFRLNKTLTWNIARMLQAGDGLAAVPHVPGTSSIEKIIKATASKGATDDAIARVREAAKAFERMIEVHVGDRATLDLIIDGLGPNGSIALEQSRKRAFLGNSGIYGVQAKANLMSCFLAPNADDPDQLDMVMLRGYVGVRRLRTTVRIPIFRLRQWSEAGQAVGSQDWGPLDDGAPDPFLREFGSGELPEIEAEQVSPNATDYVLKPGPIGNSGAFDCFFADKMLAGASRFTTDADNTGEFGTTLTVPTARVVFDLIAHRDCAFALDATAHVYAYFFTHGEHGGDWDDASRLPIERPPAELAGAPPAVATPLVPRYTDMSKYVFEKMGWKQNEFRGVRLELNYPPLGSTVVLRFDLQERP